MAENKQKLYIYAMNLHFTKLASVCKSEYGHFYKFIANDYQLIPIDDPNMKFEEDSIIYCLLGNHGVPNDLVNVLDNNINVKTRKICVVDESPQYAPVVFVKDHILEKYFDIIYRCTFFTCDQTKSFRFLTLQRRFMWSDPKTGMTSFPIPKNLHVEKNRIEDKFLMILNNKHIQIPIERQSDFLLNDNLIKNNLPLRYEIGRYLDKKNKVDLYGTGWENFTNNKGRYLGNRVSIYRNYKFCITMENCVCDNFVSEKIFDAICSGCIPIYKGGPRVKQMLPKDTFICLDDFDDKYERAIEYALDKGYEYFYRNICKNIEKIEEKIESRKYFYDLLKIGIEGDREKIISYLEDKLWWKE